jgi:hypothetical protein
MSRVAIVRSTSRVTEEGGGEGLDVVCDPGGDQNVTAPHFADAGDDSCPLPGDFVALEQSSGTGVEQAVGYADVDNAGKAAPGEKRIYARDARGAVKVELWLKGDGAIVVDNGAGKLELAPGGDVTINGVTIDKSGNVSAPGDVTAKRGPQAVRLSTHTHLSGTGPTQSPTPGT